MGKILGNSEGLNQLQKLPDLELLAIARVFSGSLACHSPTPLSISRGFFLRKQSHSVGP
jgi:hypothetical protein